MALSDAQFTAWLASASSIRTVLVEVVARIVSTETTLYLSNRNYITGSADTPASTAYQACIAGGVSTSEALNLDGSPSMSWGDIEIANADGSRDGWLDYVWANRAVNVYVGDEDVRCTGGLATALADGDEVTILPAVAGG